MQQIRLALKDNLNISVYINSKLSWQQIRLIRLNLKDGIDISE